MTNVLFVCIHSTERTGVRLTSGAAGVAKLSPKPRRRIGDTVALQGPALLTGRV